METIGNFIPITDGKVIAWNAAGEAAVTVTDSKVLLNVDKKYNL